MITFRPFLLVCAGALSGCVSIADVDTTKAEPTCARQCTQTYSQCVAAPAVGTPTGLFYQCKQALKLCLDTCPPKQ